MAVPVAQVDGGLELGREQRLFPIHEPSFGFMDIAADGQSFVITTAPYAEGQTVRVSVQIDSGLDVGALPFHIQFDGRILEFEKAYRGEFLSQDGSSPLVMAAPLQGKDEIAVGVSRPGTGPGVSGSGTLVTLEFRATGAGTTPLQFSQAKLLNSKRRQIRAEFVSSEIVVR